MRAEPVICTNAETCKRTPRKPCYHEQPHIERHDCFVTCINHGKCKHVSLTIVREERPLP